MERRALLGVLKACNGCIFLLKVVAETERDMGVLINTVTVF